MIERPFRQLRLVAPLIGLSLSAAWGAAAPAPPPAVVAEVEAWLADPSTKAPGIAVAAVNRDGIVWSGAFGLADIRKQKPATTWTRWQFASVTKVHTTLMLAELAHEGVVDLDAPIARYVPEFRPRYPEPGSATPTLRQVATHTAGITNGWGPSTHSYSAEQLMAWAAETALSIQPGLQHKYSNKGYAVLGMVLERATGRNYADLLQGRILRPFGMTSSGLTAVPPHPDLATSYQVQNGTLVSRDPSPLFYAQNPASGLVATAEDVARFVNAHLRGQAGGIPEPVLNLLFSPYFPLGDDQAIGLGWFYKWEDHLPYWYHVGAWNMFYSRIVIRPDVGVGLAFSTNGPWKRDLIAPLLKILAADADPGRLDAVTGDYADEAGLVQKIRRPPGPEMMLEIKDVGRLLPISRHTFRLQEPTGKHADWIRFIEDNGRMVMLRETTKLVRQSN